MKKVAISLSGEGKGHAARISALVRALEHKYDIRLWAPHIVHSFLKEHDLGCPIYDLPLTKLVKHNHKISAISTIIRNTPNFFKRFFPQYKLVKNLKDHGTDIILADYDPMLPLTGASLGIPTIYLGHQPILFRYPAFTFKALLALAVNLYMMPTKKYMISSSFFDGDIGPIIRDEISGQKLTKGNHILVYLTSSIQKVILPIMKEFTNFQFEFFPNKDKNYFEYFASCRGVIAPAGHQFISEALYLEKPILVIPQHGQYEQELNAKMLAKSGRGLRGSIKSIREDILFFLKHIDNFPFCEPEKGIKFIFHDDTNKAIKIIDNKINTVLSETKNQKQRLLLHTQRSCYSEYNR